MLCSSLWSRNLIFISIGFSSPFSWLGFGGFSTLTKQCYKIMNDWFLLCFLIKFKKFFINRVPDFLPCFLIEFRRFFYQLNTLFLPHFFTRLKRLFPINKAMISNVKRLLEIVFKRKNNCNIIKLYDQSCDGSNLIKTISYYNLS